MKQWIPFITAMVAIAGFWWNISTNMATKEDIRRLESRLDRIEICMGNIEQNHLDHVTRLHVQTKKNNPE